MLSLSTPFLITSLKYLLHFLLTFTPNLLHFKNLLRYFAVFYNTFSLKKNVVNLDFKQTYQYFQALYSIVRISSQLFFANTNNLSMHFHFIRFCFLVLYIYVFSFHGIFGSHIFSGFNIKVIGIYRCLADTLPLIPPQDIHHSYNAYLKHHYGPNDKAQNDKKDPALHLATPPFY